MTQVLMETVRESNLQNEICDGQPSDFRLPISDFGLGGADDGRADGAADFRLPILDFGLKAAADGVKWSGARPGQREFLFGGRPRDSAGAWSAPALEGGTAEKRLTGRYLKRDAKRWRKVAAKLEVIRRTGVASEAEVAAIRGSLDKHAFLGPNLAEVNHERRPRSP